MSHKHEIGSKRVIFLILNVICSQFVVILSLYLIAINIIKCSLNTNTLLLHNAAKVKVKVIYTETFLVITLKSRNVYYTSFKLLYTRVYIMSTYKFSLLCLNEYSFIQKVKVTENKNLNQKHYVSSSLRVFVQNLFLFTMFFNIHMRMFCFSFYMTNFLN